MSIDLYYMVPTGITEIKERVSQHACCMHVEYVYRAFLQGQRLTSNQSESMALLSSVIGTFTYKSCVVYSHIATPTIKPPRNFGEVSKSFHAVWDQAPKSLPLPMRSDCDAWLPVAVLSTFE